MIEIKDISFYYGKRQILKDISFDIEESKTIAILGNNGAGKSTLIKCLNKVIPASGGSVMVSGEDIFTMKRNEVAKRIAYVAQHTETGRITVYDAILLGRKPYIKWDATKKDNEIVREMIEHMHLEDFSLRYIDELSGGELQKVMLARALVQQPKFLLLDEPTSNLDPFNQHALMNQVLHISREHNIAVAVVIHDLNLAMRYCDKFLFVKENKVYKYGGIEIMTPQTIDDIYNLKSDIIEHNGIKVVVPKAIEPLRHGN
ncbi:MAG: ABC transporter ATP-binding protein [Clostridia bacterium]|nr:ABC transporter ATP-binding protein [Clostridia bacterium]